MPSGKTAVFRAICLGMTVFQAIPYLPNTAQALFVRKRLDARIDYYRSAKTIVHVGLEGSSRIETTSLIALRRTVFRDGFRSTGSTLFNAKPTSAKFLVQPSAKVNDI